MKDIIEERDEKLLENQEGKSSGSDNNTNAVSIPVVVGLLTALFSDVFSIDCLFLLQNLFSFMINKGFLGIIYIVIMTVSYIIVFRSTYLLISSIFEESLKRKKSLAKIGLNLLSIGLFIIIALVFIGLTAINISKSIVDVKLIENNIFTS